MAFSANPLALSVPEPAFEAWLRDTGYLEILDSSPTSSYSSSSSAAAIATGPAPVAAGAFHFFRTLAAIITLNPFAKLAAADLSIPTPSWTGAFLGPPNSFSFPSDPAQARLRVQENARRYARNYAALSIVVFACTLYQMPVALLGLVAVLGLWELFRVCCERWELEQWRLAARQVLLRLTQFATAVVLYLCNVQIALFCAICISYVVMILHASLRKLTPSMQSVGAGQHNRLQIKKVY